MRHGKKGKRPLYLMQNDKRTARAPRMELAYDGTIIV